MTTPVILLDRPGQDLGSIHAHQHLGPFDEDGATADDILQWYECDPAEYDAWTCSGYGITERPGEFWVIEPKELGR